MRLMIVFVTFGLLLSACGSNSPTATNPEPEPGSPLPGTPGTAASSPAADQSVITQVATPVSVDLGSITSTPASKQTPVELPRPGSPDPLAEVIGKATAELSARLGVGLEQVTLLSSEAVEWRDSSLGCPAPDLMYLQVITPGYRIVLEANGRQYTYHADRAGQLVLCENGRPAGN